MPHAQQNATKAYRIHVYRPPWPCLIIHVHQGPANTTAINHLDTKSNIPSLGSSAQTHQPELSIINNVHNEQCGPSPLHNLLVNAPLLVMTGINRCRGGPLFIINRTLHSITLNSNTTVHIINYYPHKALINLIRKIKFQSHIKSKAILLRRFNLGHIYIPRN